MLRLALVALFVALATAQVPCGQTPISPSIPPLEKLNADRIVGGEAAVSGSWPWQVELRREGRFICGGSLVGPRHVITAGHCVSGRENNPDQFAVRLGGFDRDVEDEEGRVQIDAEKIDLHPDYSSFLGARNDVAVITLAELVTFTERIQPVCVPTEDEGVDDEPNSCIVTGWGRTGANDDAAVQLQQVQLPFVPPATCRRSFFQLDSSMICAGSNVKGGCFGDSGGPLVALNQADNSYYLYGAVSFGSSTCSGRPTVFARISHFTDFLQPIIGGL